MGHTAVCPSGAPAPATRSGSRELELWRETVSEPPGKGVTYSGGRAQRQVERKTAQNELKQLPRGELSERHQLLRSRVGGSLVANGHRECGRELRAARREPAREQKRMGRGT